MDEPLRSRMGERWLVWRFTDVNEGSFANVIDDMIIKAKMGVKPDFQVSHGRRGGKVMAKKGDRGQGRNEAGKGVPM